MLQGTNIGKGRANRIPGKNRDSFAFLHMLEKWNFNYLKGILITQSFFANKISLGQFYKVSIFLFFFFFIVCVCVSFFMFLFFPYSLSVLCALRVINLSSFKSTLHLDLLSNYFWSVMGIVSNNFSPF